MYHLKRSSGKFKSKSPFQVSGQSMVEFALALPILLMVIYGMLETGRLLFIYSSTITAARQAVRYGSANGNNASGTPFYRDCTGIKSAAQKIGFLSPFASNNIIITYDRGLTNAGAVVSIPGVSSDPATDTCSAMNDTTLQNGDRIKVRVSTQWSPIIAIVPSWKGFTITSSAERTILRSIIVGATAEPDTNGSGSLSLTVTSSTANYDSVGDVISYTYTIKNVSGTLSATNPFNVTDNHATTNCSGAPSTLAPGASFTCTGTYSVVQADLDAGAVTNLATASSVASTSNQTGVTVPAIQNKSLSLDKTSSTTIATTAGTLVTYTYKLTNSGNVTLSAPYTITDNKIPSNQIDCTSGTSTIAPNQYVNCTASYTITSSDIDNGSVTNTATGKALFLYLGSEVISNSDTVKVVTKPLELTITPSRASVSSTSQKIIYTYTLTNVSQTTLNAPYSISDDRATNISCPSSSSLAPGAFTNCTGEYTPSQPDLDLGVNLVNNATGSANGGAVLSGKAKGVVTVTQTPALSLTITPPVTFTPTVGSPVVFTYTITNTGNVTLTSPYHVSDTVLPETAVCSSTAALAPNGVGSTTCTNTHPLTNADLTNGSVVTKATASAFLGATAVYSSEVTYTLQTYNGPRVTLSISASPNTYSSLGALLSIKFTLTNSGSVVLTPPYAVTASGFTVTCPNTPATLSMGQSVDCTAAYPASQTDLNTGSITVTGTGSAKNGASTITSASASLTIPSSFSCSMSFALPTIAARNNQLTVDLTNSLASTGQVTIKSIKIASWNLGNNQQYISSVNLVTSSTNTQIATGTSGQKSDPQTFNTSNAILTLGQTKTLLFQFAKNYTATGNETLTITFNESGCAPWTFKVP